MFAGLPVPGPEDDTDDDTVDLATAYNINLHPQDSDVFIGFSTTEGKLSPISRSRGSVFFQELGRVLQDNFKIYTLDEMFIRVTDIVAEDVHRLNPRFPQYMHVPQKVSTLRALLYFSYQPESQVKC